MRPDLLGMVHNRDCFGSPRLLQPAWYIDRSGGLAARCIWVSVLQMFLWQNIRVCLCELTLLKSFQWLQPLGEHHGPTISKPRQFLWESSCCSVCGDHRAKSLIWTTGPRRPVHFSKWCNAITNARVVETTNYGDKTFQAVDAASWPRWRWL